MVPRWRIFGDFCVLYLQRAARSTFQTCILKAKFHYAIWSHTGRKLVANLQRAGIWIIIEHELAGLPPASDLSATSFRPVCNQIATRFERSRHVEIARTCSSLDAVRFEAKFHYAIWSQTGSVLVGDLQRAGIWRII